ncbi:predicted protein [Aspergillus terreus NIH2624]|uniref:GST N-terminal domain-containing protein n=1 Tax=Aspergillus terreus (strain NIH 2624 / FGSC A1156) TaxID=341663 RepID=Q0CF90_ASPTN|nr:uncharacterized protein ATEG_07644 [Aspergillus terreus NIH2624]EAU31906.1 predicted protein [Aspergillus terreus NIH2624]
MNVFDEQRGRIALYAPKGSRHSATIVILLEKLKLPYRLHLVASADDVPDHPAIPPGARDNLPLLTNVQSDGEHVSLCGIRAILEYLLARYDEDHVVRYADGSAQERDVERWLSLVLPHRSQDKEASPARFDLEAEDGVVFARKALNLYLNLEQHLQTTRSRFLVGSKW